MIEVAPFVPVYQLVINRSAMAPVATEPQTNGSNGAIKALKAQQQNGQPNGTADQPFNPFYSPPSTEDVDDSYEYARYKVCFCDQKYYA